ncbi:MAG: DegT/DnrJ/EryC1/StrS family aminotransferase [Planctomycetota bacterium]|jgi:dTDP-4-amino-4,6-dideoxygalactose transaminase
MAITNDTKLAEKIKQLSANEMVQPTAKDKLMLTAQLAIYRTFIYPRTTALAQTLFRFLTQKGLVVGSSSTAEFTPEMADDFFKGMSAVQEKSGLRQLKKLQHNFDHRRQMADLYDQLLTEKGWPARQYDVSIMDPVMVRYPVRIKEKKQALEKAHPCIRKKPLWPRMIMKSACVRKPKGRPTRSSTFPSIPVPVRKLSAEPSIFSPNSPRHKKSKIS